MSFQFFNLGSKFLVGVIGLLANQRLKLLPIGRDFKVYFHLSILGGGLGENFGGKFFEGQCSFVSGATILIDAPGMNEDRLQRPEDPVGFLLGGVVLGWIRRGGGKGGAGGGITMLSCAARATRWAMTAAA